jgi:hypothetical protein
MKNPNGDRTKIGAWISIETKRKADLYRALSGESLQDIYEAALKSYLDYKLPSLGINTQTNKFDSKEH